MLFLKNGSQAVTEELIDLRCQGAKAHPVMINKAVRAMQPENTNVTGLFITAKLFTDVAVWTGPLSA